MEKTEVKPWEDTLVAHHSFCGHLPKSLSHVVSIYCTARPWKILSKGKDVSGEKGIAPWEAAERATTPEQKAEAIRQLLSYNAADCRLTALAWKRMDADLESERHVYESDKVMAMLCQGMTEVGIGSDETKRAEISLGLRNRKRSLLGRMRQVIGRSDFHPARLNDVRWALFGKFRAPLLKPTKTGLGDTSNDTLEYLKGRNPDSRAGIVADLILRWREAAKIKGTYIDGEHQAHDDGRVHAPWKLGPITGRLAGPLMTLPRYKKDIALQVRSIYIPQKWPTPRLVAQIHDAAIIEAFGRFYYYDLSQAEARLAAYFSGDKNLIAACESDIHTENAKVVFADTPEAIEALGRANEKSPFLDREGKPKKWKAVSIEEGGCKDYRDVAKNVGFCVWYCGSAERAFITLRADGKKATMAMCEELVRRFHYRYTHYYQYVDSNLTYAQRHGHLRTVLLGRICWTGWHPKETFISNYPIQSGIADLHNERLPRIVQELPDCKAPEDLMGLITRIWKEPIRIPHNGLEFVMPIDLKVGEHNWGEGFG